MSPTVPTSFTTVNAVTELEIHRVVFNWDIAHFDRICPPESIEFESFTSGHFVAGHQIDKASHWAITVDNEDGYLQIWCHLENILSENESVCEDVNEIRALISMSIMKPDGTEAWERSCSKSHMFSPGTDDNGWGLSNIIRLQKLWEEKHVFLADNTLRLRITLDLYGDMLYRRKTKVCSASAKRKRGDDDDSCVCPAAKVDTKSQSVLQNDLSKILTSQKMSDFTIQCGQKLFPVHKLILAARSKVFAAMLMHNTLEVQTASVKIDDINENIMEHLLNYIYTGATNYPSTSSAEMLMSLAQAADKYELNRLKNLCFYELCCRINEKNVGKMAVLAYLHNAEEDVVEEIASFYRSHWDKLTKDSEFIECLLLQPAAFFKPSKAKTAHESKYCAEKTETIVSLTDSKMSCNVK